MTLLKTACAELWAAQSLLQRLTMHHNISRANPAALRDIAQYAQAPIFVAGRSAFVLSTIPASNDSHMEAQQ